MKSLLVSTAALAIALSTMDAAAAALSGIDLRFVNDSNPAKAEFDRDIEASSSLMARLSGNLLAVPLQGSDSVRSGFSINGAVSYEHHVDIEALGESRYRLSTDWFRENLKGAGKPFVRLGLGLGYIDSETQRRDGFMVDASASINYQPSDFFDTTLGIQTAVIEAETDVFGTSKAILFTTANFSPTPKFVLRAGLRFVTGNETSTATPTLNIVNHAEFIEPDEAFGGSAEQRFAYLIDANSLIAEAGLGYGISESVNANLLYRFVSTEADGDISYKRSLVEFTLGIDL